MQLDKTKENARKLATDNENLKYALQRAENALKASIPKQVDYPAAVYCFFGTYVFWFFVEGSHSLIQKYSP